MPALDWLDRLDDWGSAVAQSPHVEGFVKALGRNVIAAVLAMFAQFIVLKVAFDPRVLRYPLDLVSYAGLVGSFALLTGAALVPVLLLYTALTRRSQRRREAFTWSPVIAVGAGIFLVLVGIPLSPRLAVLTSLPTAIIVATFAPLGGRNPTHRRG